MITIDIAGEGPCRSWLHACARSGHDRAASTRITGQLVLTLNVRDLPRSAEWYGELLSAQQSTYVDGEGILAQVTLSESISGVELALVSHVAARDELFDERRCGLDHVEFVVKERADLDAWAQRLDELGIEHSGVKEPGYTSNAMLTFRDPDNIQLEFFWRAARRELAGQRIYCELPYRC
jgi:glyoxylase I family protein